MEHCDRNRQMGECRASALPLSISPGGIVGGMAGRSPEVFDRGCCAAPGAPRDIRTAGFPEAARSAETPGRPAGRRDADLSLALDLGCRRRRDRPTWSARAGSKLVSRRSRLGFRPPGKGPAVVADEEALPFAPPTFDLVLSNLELHWVNDLPGALIQSAPCLKPDGLLLGDHAGRRDPGRAAPALIEAELEWKAAPGRASRPSPMCAIWRGLLQRAGFALPVVDSDSIEVEYRLRR